MASDPRSSVRLMTSTLVNLDGEAGKWVGTLTDVSSGGLRCSTYGRPDRSLSLGEECQCIFVLPTGVVKGAVKVIWLKQDGQLVGLEFLSVDDSCTEALEAYCESPF